MDVISAASTLRQLLIALDNSYIQVSVLDEFITTTSQRQFKSAIEGEQSQKLHLALRLSVSEGMQTMYTQYQERKWNQVQQKARSIASALQDDDQEEPASPQQPGGSTRTDKAAGLWSSAFSEFYRSC